MTNVNEIINTLAAGKMIILVDDVSPLESAYLFQAAEHITTEDVAFMARVGGGVILAPMLADLACKLNLPQMTQYRSLEAPEFTISIDARNNITTGISAHDRALSLRVLAKTEDALADLVTPGHIFPIRARQGGVLVRSGFAEATVDLLQAANCIPVAAVCHCLNKKNSDYLDNDEINELISSTQLKSIRISEVITFRMTKEMMIEKVASSKIPTSTAGEFKIIVFKSKIDQVEHIALIKGDALEQAAAGKPVLVRVQAESRVGDLLGVNKALNRSNIYGALQAIEQAKAGVFVYIRHPQKGVLEAQVQAIAKGIKIEQATKGNALRELGTGAQILTQLGIRKIILLTNSSRPLSDLSAFDLHLEARVPYEPIPRSTVDFSLAELLPTTKAR